MISKWANNPTSLFDMCLKKSYENKLIKRNVIIVVHMFNVSLKNKDQGIVIFRKHMSFFKNFSSDIYIFR